MYKVMSESFFSEIQTEVQDRLVSFDDWAESVRSDLAFAEYASELLVDAQILPDFQLCPLLQTEGRNRSNFHAALYNEDFKRLEIFLCNFSPESALKTIPKDQVRRMSLEATRGLKAILEEDYADLIESEEASENIQNLSQYFEEVESIRLILCTNLLYKERQFEVEEASKILGFEAEIDVDLFDVVRLSRLVDSKRSRQNIDINIKDYLPTLLPCLEMRPRPEQYETFLAIFPGQFLYELYDKYGSQLFEFNVRSFLSNRGKVNRGIKATLEGIGDDSDDQNVAERFMAYNNGIVGTVDEIEIDTSLDGQPRIVRMVGFQIVNGAQTTASIYKTKKMDKADRVDLSKINVAAKITKVDDALIETFVPKISLYAKTQNNVQVADLSANHKFHIFFERLSIETWSPDQSTKWFYERARGSYEEELSKYGTTKKLRDEFIEIHPKNQKITKTDLAKYIVAWNQNPSQVTAGAQKNFALFMDSLGEFIKEDDSTIQPNEEFFRAVVAQKIIFSAIQKICRKQLDGYRSEVANYALSSLSRLTGDSFNLEIVWDHQSISDELHQFLETLVSNCDRIIRLTAGAQDIREWCKKSACWEQLQELIVEIQVPANMPELEVKSPDDPNTEEQVENPEVDGVSKLQQQGGLIALTDLEEDDWRKLIAWGTLQ